jgi:hypothetical protein
MKICFKTRFQAVITQMDIAVVDFRGNQHLRMNAKKWYRWFFTPQLGKIAFCIHFKMAFHHQVSGRAEKIFLVQNRNFEKNYMVSKWSSKCEEFNGMIAIFDNFCKKIKYFRCMKICFKTRFQAVITQMDIAVANFRAIRHVMVHAKKRYRWLFPLKLGWIVFRIHFKMGFHHQKRLRMKCRQLDQYLTKNNEINRRPRAVGSGPVERKHNSLLIDIRMNFPKSQSYPSYNPLKKPKNRYKAGVSQFHEAILVLNENFFSMGLFQIFFSPN